MKILKVIHGYPPYYNAGSEIYSQILAHELAEKHEVQVFTRHENSFLPDFHYSTELDGTDLRILLHLINIPVVKYRYRFINDAVDNVFLTVLEEFKPDIVHFGHLNHLSFNLPSITHKLDIPSIYTLHDFWLMCPRGRFILRNSDEPLKLCDSQADRKCAVQCYSGYFTGDENFAATDVLYWQNWIANRMIHTRKIIEYIDHFIAPSKYIMQRFIREFNLPEHKISYLDYGFNLERFAGRKREKEDDFVFGYIGTHTPEKGIDLLLNAFANVDKHILSKIRLRIWGANTSETNALKAITKRFNRQVFDKIEWMGSYGNKYIVDEVFNKVDTIVVPSIWGENSPLVIHEAQQVKVPVITSDYGGMAEYVQDGVNGLLFEHRNVASLTKRMQLLAMDDLLREKLGSRGYLYSYSGQVPAIKDHISEIEKIYHTAAKKRGKYIPTEPGPWRITFDTNPDYCNYACVMCECFSPYSTVKEDKKAKGIKPKIMPIGTIRKIIEEAAGTPLREIIPSTMGEPLMYKNFDEIINLCHEYGLKLNLTTNGSFVIKGARKWAESLVPVLSDIKISWNGATKETHEKIMIGSRWEEVIENLKIFLAVRDEYFENNGITCSVTLQSTFLESNFHELYDLVKMSIKLGVDRVKGHHLWSHFEEIKDLSMRRDVNTVLRWNNEVEKIFKLRDEELLPSGKKIKLENFTILNTDIIEDLAPGGICPFLGKEAWINPKGKFSPCCAPDEPRNTLGNFGNVNNTKIDDIWQSEAYRNLRKNYLNYDLCKTCNMKKALISR